ncbi:MAG: PAS-domain containing protein [Devosia sp.]
MAAAKHEDAVVGQGSAVDVRTAAAAAAFDAVDHALLVFDENERLVAFNQGCALLFHAGALCEGQSAEEVGSALAQSEAMALAGPSTEGIARTFALTVRACEKTAEFRRTGGGVLCMTSTPGPEGGRVVALRDGPCDRLGDRRTVALLRDGLDAVAMGTLLWDAHGRVRMVNAAWISHVCEARAGDAVGRIEATMRRRGLLPADVALQGKGLLDGPKQVDVSTPDGRHLRYNAYPTRAGGVLATVLDVTERSHSEARARDMLRVAAEPLQEGIMLLDRDKRLVLCNDAAVSILFCGIDPPKPGVHITEINRALMEGGVLPPPPGISLEEMNARYIELMEAFTQDYEATLGDGRVVIGSVYPTELGGYLYTLRDVTEARRSAEEARDNAEILKAVIEASQAMLCVARAEDGKLVYASPSFYDTFGPVRRMPEIYADLANDDEGLEIMRAGEGVGVSRCRRQRDKHGRVLETFSSSKEIMHRGERVVVVTSLDVTEFEAMREELERQREIAHQTEKISALGELLAGVAHELSNPLSVIVGYAAMLRDDATEEDVRRRADRVAKAAERCASIVRTFLAMARRRPAKLQPCPVDELISTTLMAAGGAVRAQGARIVVDAGDTLPCVAADRDQIVQVLANLIQNAAHAMNGRGKDGRLEIAARARGPDIDITVHDNGPGVPDALRHRLFEPFFTTKPVGEGTGIGLAFCHRVAAAHGGSLTLDDGGSGATFRLRLPQAQGPQVPRNTADGTATRSLRVLLLDDEPEVLAMSKSLFDRAGHRAATALRAEDALRMCARARFDAILCDARMPGIDGPDFLRLLGEVAPEQVERLAFVTGDAMNPAMLTKLGATRRPILEKPVAPEEMLSLAARLAGDGG